MNELSGVTQSLPATLKGADADKVSSWDKCVPSVRTRGAFGTTRELNPEWLAGISKSPYGTGETIATARTRKHTPVLNTAKASKLNTDATTNKTETVADEPN